MRKIKTIQKEIGRSQAAIHRAEGALPRLQARMNNAIVRLSKAGYEFKGDGSDPMNCINNVRLWSIAYTADEARKGIERRRAEISRLRMDLDILDMELAEATRILTRTDNQNKRKIEMKYKGIELKEFTSEKPVIFDPPKRMLVWDYDDETPTEKDVIAFIPNRYHKAIEQMSVYIHCAEIPEVMCRRATNRELAKWLAQGNGQLHTSGFCYVWAVFSYDIGHDDEVCSIKVNVRKWEDKEWHEPTREYLGLED